MERNLGKLAGAVAFALAMTRLGRLLESEPTGMQWPPILLAAALLGAVGWWLLNQLVRPHRVALALFTIGGLLLFLRIGVPHTLALGIVPSADTLPVLAAEIGDAFRLIRYGVAPVFPNPGMVAILAALMWCIGAMYSAGAASDSPVLMVLPSLVTYLQFTIFDRFDAGPVWMLAGVAAFGLAMSALAVHDAKETGRARDVQGRVIARTSPGVALATAALVGVVAVAGATSAVGLVPDEGNIRWRAATSGYGPAGGGTSFSRLVDLRQSIISRSNEVLFRATLSEGAPPGDRIYWRMETLDDFDGVAWRPSDTTLTRYRPGEPVSRPWDRYQGSTVEIVQRIKIDTLRSDLLPTAGVTAEIHPVEGEGAIPLPAFQITPDASLYYTGGTRKGHTYQLQTTYSAHELDLAGLALGADGELSPLFAAAVEAGAFPEPTAGVRREVAEPADLESFTRLPEVPRGIAQTAAGITAGATSDFERAWMLQHWFRDSGDFTYSTEVTTGHSALVLEDWLSDPESTNFRTGYCEQFAAAMAVMGRALGIPSRVVWGFTPGAVTFQEGLEVVEVRDTNAHAWVEMWMEGHGWVPFEPTPRGEFIPASATSRFDPADFVTRSQLPLPTGDFPFPGLTELERFLGDFPTGFPVAPAPDADPRWWLLVLPALLASTGLVPALKAIRRRHRIRMLREGDITAAWDEIVDRLTDLGHEVTPSKTPIELANTTHASLLPLARSYSAAVYGGKEVGPAGEFHLGEAEGWLATGFDGLQRARAAVNPRSLMRRKDQRPPPGGQFSSPWRSARP